MILSDADFKDLSEFILEQTGIYLTEHKKILLVSRLRTVLDQYGLPDFSAYYTMLKTSTDKSLVMELVNRITTNHTYFYRESKHYDFLTETILPEIIASNTDYDIRIWSAGCSTGEEPYTLSMVLFEYFGLKGNQWNMEILATDISKEALGKAHRGIYREQQFVKLPQKYLKKYFKLHDEGYEISQRVKNNVVLRIFNLMDPLPFKRAFDIIFCRNVMIYFTAETRKKLIEKFVRGLRQGGYLVIGHSETIDKTIEGLEYIQPSIYRRL